LPLKNEKYFTYFTFIYFSNSLGAQLNEMCCAHLCQHMTCHTYSFISSMTLVSFPTFSSFFSHSFYIMSSFLSTFFPTTPCFTIHIPFIPFLYLSFYFNCITLSSLLGVHRLVIHLKTLQWNSLNFHYVSGMKFFLLSLALK